MAQLIDKAALVAEIERRTDELYDLLPDASKVENGTITVSEACNTGKYTALESFRKYIDTLEVKEVDLGTELGKYIEHYRNRETGYTMFGIAEHFFELGLSVNNPVTASDKGMVEEIIINLKRVEQDYHIDLTKEMEWLRNKVKKGE